jgi:hypothetical protein
MAGQCPTAGPVPRPRWPRFMLACVLFTASWMAVAGNTVAPKGFQGYEGKIHASAAQACAEFDKGAGYTATGGPTWDDFFKE